MFGKNLTSKTIGTKIFRGFRVFEYFLWQKAKTRKCRNQQEAFYIKKTSGVSDLPLLENC